MSFNRGIERGVNQVMYKYAPGATFSHPRHGTIERISRITARDGERIGLSNNEEIIQEVYARVMANDGGVIGEMPPSRDNYALVRPGKVYSSIFPRLFACYDCGKLHDYTEHGGPGLDNLPNHGGTCLRSGCNGRLYQIHHVLVCPDCSNMESLTHPVCSTHRGQDEYMVLDDSADRYQDFRWVCRACGDNTIAEGVHAGCSRCGTQMIPTVHSGSQSHRVQSFTRVDLGGHDVYTAGLADDDIDLLVLGTLFDMYDREEHSIESLASGSGASLDVDPDSLSADELELIRNSVDFGEGGPREVVISEVNERLDNPVVSRNLRDYMMMREALELDEVATGPGSERANQLMDMMGIDTLSVTSEYPLLACSYGYKRTFEDQNGDDGDNGGPTPEPAVRLFPVIQVDDESRRPIYTKRSETEALIVELDPRKVGHWLKQVAQARDDIPDRLPDFHDLDRSGARIALYDVLGPVATYEDIETRNPDDDPDPHIDPHDVDSDVPLYTPETVTVHRLIHSIAHLCMQNASMYSGIQENNFAEFLFPEALSFAIYAKQTESYTAGGLYTLVNRRLPEWLRGAYQDGEQCFYDSTCANIWGGSCHACLHTGEISCQHFNANLSRVDLYGQRIADVDFPGFWTMDWDRVLPHADD